MSEFFVGYLATPPGTARFLRGVIAGLGLLAITMALLLLRGQASFATAAFEYGKVRTFEGTISTHPYPSLGVPRPGTTGADRYSRYLLVAAGKHGADTEVAAFEGKPVRLQGFLIYRGGGTMIEIVPGSIVGTGAALAVEENVKDSGTVTLTGEIVDSKCYLGVMNPGQGKVHRDCAARCLSGGIPPLFIADHDGTQLLLVDKHGKALEPDQLREFVAQPLTLSGHLARKGAQNLLMIDPTTLRHAAANNHSRAVTFDRLSNLLGK